MGRQSWLPPNGLNLGDVLHASALLRDEARTVDDSRCNLAAATSIRLLLLKSGVGVDPSGRAPCDDTCCCCPGGFIFVEGRKYLDELLAAPAKGFYEKPHFTGQSFTITPKWKKRSATEYPEMIPCILRWNEFRTGWKGYEDAFSGTWQRVQWGKCDYPSPCADGGCNIVDTPGIGDTLTRIEEVKRQGKPYYFDVCISLTLSTTCESAVECPDKWKFIKFSLAIDFPYVNLTPSIHVSVKADSMFCVPRQNV